MNDYYLTKDSGNTLVLDQVASVETGLPGKNFSIIATLGEGGIIQGVGQRSGREWSAQYNFRTEDEWERENFISFFNNNIYDDMYLYKRCTQRFKCNISAGSTIVTYKGSTSFFNRLYNDFTYSQGTKTYSIYGVGLVTTSVTIANIISGTTNEFHISSAANLTIANTELEIATFTGRTQVYASIDGGESYSNSAISEGIGLKLLSESPFFTSTALFLIGGQAITNPLIETAITVVNIDIESPPVFSFTMSSAATSCQFFQVKTAYGYGFKVQKQVNAGDIITVDCSGNDLALTINGYSQTGYFTESSQPFNILSGSNILYCAIPQTTAFNVKLYQRRV